MVLTDETYLPTDEELTVEELNIGTPSLMAGAFHFGKKCENENNEFVLCRNEEEDPRKCLTEGKAVTACVLDFFRQVKKSCYKEFTQHANCLNRSSSDLHFRHCRKTQTVYDKCVLDNLQIERPYWGYFCLPKVHHTDRPKPKPIEPKKNTDVPVEPPEGTPRPPAKYGLRLGIAE